MFKFSQREASYTPWIRASNGRLCIDLSDGTTECYSIAGFPYQPVENLPRLPMMTPASEWVSKIISSLNFRQFHELLALNRLHAFWQPISRETTVQPSAIIHYCPDNVSEIAYIPQCAVYDSNWHLQNSSDGRITSTVMPNGWTRYVWILDSSDASGSLNLVACKVSHPWI
ncbi:hypothetical protein C8R43DRAFT_173595 [Mycena crocata]|nr:hypothetical protein C8R43DRAFT_173595 [Mycena crocata]